MRKLGYEEVKLGFEKQQWKLISMDYTGSQKPLNVICPNGHETTITWNNFQRGQGCRFCAGNIKYDLEYVRQKFAERECELLEIVYVNNLVPLKFRCKCGNISQMRFADFLRGRACQQCKGKHLSQLLRTPHEAIETFCAQNKCKLVRTWVQNKKTRIEYICKCGEIAEAYWTNFRHFPNCKKCGNAKVSGDKCYRWNPDREKIQTQRRYQKTCGRLLRRALKATSQQKDDHTYNLLGYTSYELQRHIQEHPNYTGEDNMHVDHIFPIKAFLDHGITDLKLINTLDNLQPLDCKENLQKADDYDNVKFEQWLHKQVK